MSAHTSQTELKLIGKLILEGEMHCETGLHVGAGKGSLEIGGSDNPVVKDAFGRPYVPGSSLRGKIRSLLEQSTGLAVPAELVYLSRRKGQEVRIHQSDRPDDEICLLFGRNPGRMERVQGETPRDRRRPRRRGSPSSTRRSIPRASRPRCARTWTTSSPKSRARTPSTASPRRPIRARWSASPPARASTRAS